MDIKLLQSKINELNFTTTLTEDGLMGLNTSSAIEKFKTLSRNSDISEDNLIDVLFMINRLIDDISSRINHTGYLTQRTQYQYSSRMCNIACLLMLKNYYNKTFQDGEYLQGVKNAQQEIEELDKLIDKDKELRKWAEKRKLYYYINNNKLEQISKIIAIILSRDTDFTFDLSYLTINEIKAKLERKHPLIVSTRFPGRKHNNLNAGHYVVITGFFNNIFSINDPYGLWENYYRKTSDINKKGEKVVIHQDDLFGQWGCKSESDDKVYNKRTDKYRIISIVEEM